MKRQKALFIVLTLTLTLSLLLGVSKVQAATYPTFTIKSVEKGVSVTIQTKDVPAGKNFKVLMGEIGTKAIDGIEVATFNSGDGGAFEATFNIPEELKTRAQIAIRFEGTDNDYYAYNWFWNDEATGTWPTPPAPPAPAPAKIPTISIKAVEAGKTVTIVTSDFPKAVEFTVLMGKMGTAGIGGIEVAKLDSGEGGSFEATLNIPEALKDDQRIAIRLNGVGGYYAYNWFWNNTGTPPVEPPVPPVEGYKGYPYFFIDAVVKDTSVTITAHNLPKDYEFTVLMGKMWTKGIKGIEVTTFNSGEGGDLTATYNIPAELAGEQRISIRLQGELYYAYNWFWNSTTAE